MISFVNSGRNVTSLALLTQGILCNMQVHIALGTTTLKTIISAHLYMAKKLERKEIPCV